MINFNSLKKKAALTAIFMLSSAFAEQPLGLIGGQNTPNSGPVYAAHISPSGVVSPITGLPSNCYLNTAAINASSQGLLGGQHMPFTGPGYAAIVSPSGIATEIATSLTIDGIIASVAINDLGQGLIGGSNAITFAPYAALVSPSGIATELTGLPAMGTINDVAINSSSLGLIGGTSTPGPVAYAAFVSPSGIAIPIAGLPPLGAINSVALNDSGQGLIGGQETPLTGPAYAALISPSGVATSIPGLPSDGSINSVAINSVGHGIIGGQEAPFTGAAYAALVSPSGIATPINLGISSGAINSVAINDFGQGLIGGQENLFTGAAYAAIVSPSGIATPINLDLSSGAIYTVAILNKIPTGTLSGNNLTFANYINENAPQDAFYFVPAFYDGTLSQALESAAPTRNAFSIYTASSNLFYLTTSLSNHIRNRSRYIRKADQTSIAAVTDISEGWQSEELMVSASDELTASIWNKPKKTCEVPVTTCECPEEKKTSVWFEVIGAFAYQQAQHQTPGFHPSTGGAILAYDGKTCEHTRMGIGVSYLYTHIDEKKKAGHSNINQEDLFVYGSLENKNFYLDVSVLGGLFQVDQVRKIHMSGFEFKSTSHPHGWQLLPHAELGYHYTRPEGVELTFNPFVMVDWANAWQNRYHEKGSGPFNAGQKSHHSSLLRTEASLRLYETLFFDSWDLVFQEKAGYVNVHSFGAGRVNAFLVGSPGSFTVTTLTSDQNLGVAEFAMIFAPHESSLTSTLFYQGEFGSKYQSHQVALELAWNF